MRLTSVPQEEQSESTSPQDAVDQEQVQEQPDAQNLGIRELLTQAQEMIAHKSRFGERVSQIKDVLNARIRAQYTPETNQLQLFNDLGGLAFRNPEDVNEVIVEHPDVPLNYRYKRSHSVKWTSLMQQVSQEIARLQSLESPELHRNRIEALEWVLALQERHSYVREYGRFRASTTRRSTQDNSNRRSG